jgi:hypothetical protein
VKRSPKGLKIEFSGKSLTHFGGLSLLQKYFQKINLRYLLNRHLSFSQRNNRYCIAEEVLALLYPIILGLGRIETFHLLKHNGVFQYLTGLPAYPNPTTLRRFLLRMAPMALSRLRKLHNRLLLTMIQKPDPPRKIIFDLDSTVLPLYGKQESAAIGYNPAKKGRPSYHPLLCFNGLTRDYWQGELRPGDTHTATGAVELLQAVFAKTPASVKVKIVRGDKGFYDHKTVEYLESKKALFAIVARLTKPVKRKLSALTYKIYTSGTETSEFIYQPTKWKKAYRFIGAVGPADAFFFGEIQLSGDRHGSPDQSAQRLEVLQRSGRDRVDHQRAEGGLPVGQNPDEVFCGQRGVFSSTVVRLQSGQLVQTALFAEGVSETDAEKLAGTDSSGAQRTDPDGKQTDPEVPSELLA